MPPQQTPQTLQAGAGLTAGAAEQQRWLHALDMLGAALSLLTEGDANKDRFEGLAVRLAHPGSGDDEIQGWAVAADSRDEALSQQVGQRQGLHRKQTIQRYLSCHCTGRSAASALFQPFSSKSQ